jgi:hypothetical protein
LGGGIKSEAVLILTAVVLFSVAFTFSSCKSCEKDIPTPASREPVVLSLPHPPKLSLPPPPPRSPYAAVDLSNVPHFFIDTNNDDTQPNKILLPALPAGIDPTTLKSGVRIAVKCLHENTAGVKLFFLGNQPQAGIPVKSTAETQLQAGAIKANSIREFLLYKPNDNNFEGAYFVMSPADANYAAIDLSNVPPNTFAKPDLSNVTPYPPVDWIAAQKYVQTSDDAGVANFGVGTFLQRDKGGHVTIRGHINVPKIDTLSSTLYSKSIQTGLAGYEKYKIYTTLNRNFYGSATLMESTVGVGEDIHISVIPMIEGSVSIAITVKNKPNMRNSLNVSYTIEGTAANPL